MFIDQRRRKRISVGPAGDAEMERVMRVQANFTEYAPIALTFTVIALLGIIIIYQYAAGA